MEPNLDQVRQELADIHDELLALPTDAFDRRSRLKDRQNELRQLSHRMVDGQPLHDAAHLKAAYDRLHAVRDHLLDDRIAAASTGDSAVWGEISMSINSAIDAGIGTDEIERRLKEILGQLRSSS
ncbi:MAG: hypothetical protein V3S26_10350 [Acidimicrobiia bacterium]